MLTDVEKRVVPLTGLAKFPRRPLDVTQLSGANMKGFAVQHLIELMQAEGGPAVVDAWRAELPDTLRSRIERLTSVGWVPVELYYSGVSALARRGVLGSARSAISIGHAAASKDIGAFFRAVMQFTSPATVLQLSGRFWRSYFDVSSLHVVSSTARHCVLEVRNWPLVDELSPHEMAGSLIAWMEASRAKDVKVTRFEFIAPTTFAVEAVWS